MDSGTGVGAALIVGGLVRTRRGGILPAVLEAVALAVHLQDVDVVGEPVQQRADEPFGSKHAVHSSKGRLVVTRMEPRS